MIKKFILSTFVLAAAFISISAQENTSELQRAEMKKLDSMIGQWKGSGWIQQGQKRETFTGTETVQRKIDGLALLVEGKFTNPEGRVIHETLAVIAYQPKDAKYRFRTYLATGISGEHDLKTLPEAYEWGFQFPGGQVRYTIKTSGDMWNEIGEYSKDGKSWVKFFEMNLKKVS